MKQYLLITTVLAISASFVFMGFQCGSAETTSAKLYMSRKDWPAAEKALMKEVEKNPTNAEGWFLLGDVRREMGDVKGMVSAFESSLKINNEWQKKISDSRLSVWGTKINLGVAKYNASKNVAKDTSKVMKDSSAVLLEESIKAYIDAITAIPDSAVTYQDLSLAYLAKGNRTDAIDAMKKTLARKNDPQVWKFLLETYQDIAADSLKAKNKPEADKYYNLAIQAGTDGVKANPDEQDLLAILIDCYTLAGRSLEALPFVKQAVDKDPENKVYRSVYGLLLLQTNDYPGAIEQYDAAIAIDSSFTDALRNGSVAYMKLGQKEKDAAAAKAESKPGATDKSYQKRFLTASKLLEKYLTIKPEDATVWQILATAYQGADNTKKAMEALKKSDSLEKK